MRVNTGTRTVYCHVIAWRVLLAALTFALSSCGGDDGKVPSATYTVGGYVAGLTGSGLAVSFNGGSPVVIARNGAFIATNQAASASTYSVTLTSQPTNPAQLCVLSNGSGTVGTVNVTSIRVFCPQAVGRRAYVVTQGPCSPVNPPVPGAISVFNIDSASGALTLVPGSSVTTGPVVNSFQFVPHSSFAWALSGSDVDAVSCSGGIYEYSVDSGTGLLSSVAGIPFEGLRGTSNTPPGCPGPSGASGLGYTSSVSLDPGGMFGYAANSFFATVSNAGTWVFTIDPANGAPSLGSSVSGACGVPVTIDPSGQFAYLVSGSPGSANTSLSAYTIDPQTGALTAVPGASPQLDGNPAKTVNGSPALTIDPFGRFLYAFDGGKIWGFTIDPSSGAVAELAGSPFALPSTATSMAIEPSGSFAYVTGGVDAVVQGVYTYAIDPATGALAPVGGPVALQLGYNAPLQIDPSGQFAYVTGSSGSSSPAIYGYAINVSTGALTLVPGSPFAVGLSTPAVMAVAD
jgi:6-phosphogluconolactonase (cycloisomerase 2 family)